MKSPDLNPPKWARWLLIRLHPKETLEEVDGDLEELYVYWHQRAGKLQATLRYLLNVVSVLPPFVRERRGKEENLKSFLFHPDMLRNYLKIAWRNLCNQPGFTAINIGGLAIGMAVALLIGLWVWDEVTYNKNFPKYDRIGRLLQNRTFDGKTGTYPILPMPIAAELRSKYADFESVALAIKEEHKFVFQNSKLTQKTYFVETDFTKIFDLKIENGIQNGINEPNTVLLSVTSANALFGGQNPIGKIIRMDNKVNLQVTGVFKDFSKSTQFADIHVIAPFANYLSMYGLQSHAHDWGSSSYDCYVLLKPNASFDIVQAKIFKIFDPYLKQDEKFTNPEVLVHAMKDWHLRSNFENGKMTGGSIELVWLFGTIGLFVLILACINFMNLNTARSEKRAKEVGIRKAIGSARSQLIHQFLGESLLVATLAFGIALVLVWISLGWFNQLVAKSITLPLLSSTFWLTGLGVMVTTGLLAGSYPALYLSSFAPMRVLKGTFRVGRLATVPRKILVIVQFTVSITIIIGTLIVYRQIQHVKKRPIGYDRGGLLYLYANTPELMAMDYNTLRSELMATGLIANMCQSDKPSTEYGSLMTGFKWKGFDSKTNLIFETIYATHDYAKTLGLWFQKGRDFSRTFATDSAAILVNESAARLMGEKDIIGKKISKDAAQYTVIGVISDVVFANPFQKTLPQIFFLDYNQRYVIIIKLKSEVNVGEAITKLTDKFNEINPAAPFDYKFVDDEFARKFISELQISHLSTFFAVLAIFISCLGLFGLASFIAEQRTKEIGIRKVLGASVADLWQLLSKDFILLVMISSVLAIPLASYYLNEWLKTYEYRTRIPWWIFAVSGLGALVIALLTVSYQAIKAASVNPVRSLRSE